MADDFLTLLDITKRSGTDQAVGLVEEVTTFAPEIDVIMGRPIRGTTFKTKKRKSLPAGPAFRDANEGSDISSSDYEQGLAQCFYLDGQMQVDTAVAEADENGLESVLADEATGLVRQKMIAVGNQFYKGTNADAKGFQGLKQLYDASNMEVSAGGGSGSATSAYLVWNDIQGVHFIFGNNAGLDMGEWNRQQVTDSNSKHFTAWVNSLSGWIGLAMVHTKSVARIKLITDSKPLTDALISEAFAKFPIGQKPNMIFMNRDALFYLQRSRSAGTASTGSTPLVWPEQPTQSNGVPITVTDSIPSDE